MATYAVEFRPAAERCLEKLDRPVQERVAAKIRDLADEPRPPGTKALAGVPGALRVRVGDYRIVYRVDDGILVIVIVEIGHRRQVYRRL